MAWWNHLQLTWRKENGGPKPFKNLVKTKGSGQDPPGEKKRRTRFPQNRLKPLEIQANRLYGPAVETAPLLCPTAGDGRFYRGNLVKPMGNQRFLLEQRVWPRVPWCSRAAKTRLIGIPCKTNEKPAFPRRELCTDTGWRKGGTFAQRYRPCHPTMEHAGNYGKYC